MNQIRSSINRSTDRPHKRLSKPRSMQLGQAMSEFVVAAGFVLVPLFLIISISGKNADIKYASVQAARYHAWEYTANYYETGQIEEGFDKVPTGELPVKSASRVEAEAFRRFYSDTSTPLSSVVDGRGYDAANDNPLWYYHDGSPMLNIASVPAANASSLDPNEATPDIPIVPIFGTILDVVDTASTAIASIYSALGIDAGFTAIDSDGLAESKVAIAINDTPLYGGELDANTGGRQRLLTGVTNLQMRAESSILTTNWSAGGTDHTTFQVRGLVPTVIIDELLSPGGVDLQILFDIIPGFDEFGSGSLEFGKLLEDEDLHPSKVKETETLTHTCDKGGECEY